MMFDTHTKSIDKNSEENRTLKELAVDEIPQTALKRGEKTTKTSRSQPLSTTKTAAKAANFPA